MRCLHVQCRIKYAWIYVGNKKPFFLLQYQSQTKNFAGKVGKLILHLHYREFPMCSAGRKCKMWQKEREQKPTNMYFRKQVNVNNCALQTSPQVQSNRGKKSVFHVNKLGVYVKDRHRAKFITFISAFQNYSHLYDSVIVFSMKLLE